jgi:hypothetical protein
MRRQSRTLPCFFHAALLALAVAVLSVFASGCAAGKGEGFAIYLTRDDVPPARIEAPSRLNLADRPMISMEDVITYNAQTHELKLSAGAFERIHALDVPVRGRTFVVCIDRRPVYRGAFWTPVSSMSFDGVTIWKPYSQQGAAVVTLEAGYPAPSFYAGSDPRNSPEILDVLRRDGKLIDKLSIESVPALPPTMKGYELYSWREDSQWRFTLITGTDRNKTLEELVSGYDFISEAGWVKATVTGTDDIEAALGKLARGESVLWLSGVREPSQQTGVTMQLPPPEVVGAVRQFAIQRGLDFQVQAQR